MEIQDLNEEFENQRQSYHADLRDQQLQIDLLTGTDGSKVHGANFGLQSRRSEYLPQVA